jgi:flagellar motor switch protein FliN/FliY
MENSLAGGAGDSFRWLAEQWAARLGQVLESMTLERPEVSVESTPPALEAGSETLWWRQEWNLAARPLLLTGVPRDTWMELGGRMLRAAGVEDPSPADARQTCLEILSQTCAGLAQALTAKRGQETVCTTGGEERQPPPAATGCSVKVAFGGINLPALWLSFDPLLVEAAGGKEDDPAGTETAPGAMDLLLDVEMPVSISFGRAQVPLEEVMKLTAGSVIELDRAVNDPVEVIVNNCVVALGEMVVVEGNYGVRIQRLLSRQGRLPRVRDLPSNREKAQKIYRPA